LKGQQAKNEREKKRVKEIPLFFFFFLFKIFQSYSSKDFEILFEFSNGAHNTKYYATA
jgi:hypothetical protein